MQLTLRPTPTAQRPASAAFLRGPDPATWLRELGGWNLAAGQLSCYLVPESIRSVRVAGLLVVVKDGLLPADVLAPYGQVAGQPLYVPVQATLWPATTPEELRAALLWPMQFWHPSIGLVGFDTADELDLSTLLTCPPPRPTDWSRARPGAPPRPPLQQLRVLPPTAAEVVTAMQQDIGNKPLSELAEPEPPRVGWGRLLHRLQRGLLQAGLTLTQQLGGTASGQLGGAGKALQMLGKIVVILWIFRLALGALAALGKPGAGSDQLLLLLFVLALGALFALGRFGFGPIGYVLQRLLAARPASEQPGAAGTGQLGPGALQRLTKWLNGRLDDLEKKRQTELERLMRLFEDNPAEALRYAIPLGGLYQDRGTAPATATLGARDTRFNLGGLGGGRSADTWDLGDFQQQLRQQYLAAAGQAVAAGHFQQAAYIHAHLLADYLAAANVLEQGHLYREAAALHQDHLRNPGGAAQCLERGGLLLEAADLYASLDQHEKAGDLHTQLTQPEVAARHYERGVTLLLTNDDRPAAARLLADKLHATARAEEVLLQGWASPKQPEVCLTQYFEVVAAAPAGDLSAAVTTVYQQHTTTAQRVPLLRVLATVADKHPAPALLATAREVAYEVVSAEASAGNLAPLPLLHHFEPTDRLLAADCSRYASQRPQMLAALPIIAPQLDATTEWKIAVSHGQQWVSVGIRNERLHLARGDWHGHSEYYSWTTPVPATEPLVLVADEHNSQRIILRCPSIGGLETKLLPKNKHFPIALTVECPSWLPPWPTRVALLPEGEVTTAVLTGGGIQVQRYAAEGQLLGSFIYQPAADEPALSADMRTWPCEMLYHQGKYYTYWGEHLLYFSETAGGFFSTATNPVVAYQLVRSPYEAALQLAAALDESFLCWNPADQYYNIPPMPGDSNQAGIDLRFVGPDYLVAVDTREAYLYQLGNGSAQLLRTIPAEKQLVAVLPVSRSQFALLEVNGRVSLHELS